MAEILNFITAILNLFSATIGKKNKLSNGFEKTNLYKKPIVITENITNIYYSKESAESKIPSDIIVGLVILVTLGCGIFINMRYGVILKITVSLLMQILFILYSINSKKYLLAQQEKKRFIIVFFQPIVVDITMMIFRIAVNYKKRIIKFEHISSWQEIINMQIFSLLNDLGNIFFATYHAMEFLILFFQLVSLLIISLRILVLFYSCRQSFIVQLSTKKTIYWPYFFCFGSLIVSIMAFFYR